MPSYETLGPSRSLVAAVTLLTAAWYIAWRWTTLNPAAPIFSALLFGAECFGIITLLLHLFMLRRLTHRESPASQLGHRIDVFIPTLNESADIVRRTAQKAFDMAYPHITYILDDGNRPEIAALAETLGCRYLARGSNKDAKAGNLNFALERSSGEFIAIFDADHAPKRNFLLQTLGYFSDPQVAFVQTPQDFYNLDSYQHRLQRKRNHVWSEQSLFFRVIQRGKDYWNAAFFCGSCAVIRRSHLISIGGFATGTVTEDLHTSIRLHKAGYASVYHAESLAFGIAAPQIEPFLRQRIRWGQGAMQVWRKEAILCSRRLTWAQKLNYLASILTYFDGWQKCIYYFTPAITLITGWMPLAATPGAFLLHFTPCLIMMLWCFEELGRGYGETLIIEQYNMARFAAFCFATLALFKTKLSFRVTSKIMTGSNSHLYLLPQYAILALNLIAIPAGLILHSRGAHLNLFSLSANMAWAAINLLLSGIVLSFSLKCARFRRQHYRFSIPLVARLQSADGSETFAAIDDLSCTGARLLAPQSVSILPGDRFSGQLYLPDNILNFTAVACVTHDAAESTSLSVIGCEFLWSDNSQRTALEQFLYGSDFEWQVHNLTERRVTPLDRCLPTYKAAPLPSWRKTDQIASIMLMPPAHAERLHTGIACLSEQAMHGMAILFAPLPQHITFATNIFTRDGWKPMQARLSKQHRLSDPHSNLYIYQLEGIPA